MDFRILGPLEVADEGRPVEVGGARQRALLLTLLLRRGEPAPSDRLIGDLYGEQPPATATKTLQAHVSRLRKALGTDERLFTKGGGYALELRDGELDADRFARDFEAGRRALGRGEHEEAERSLVRALGSWRGPPLADVAYEDFAQGEIARLETLRLSATEELMETRLALGRHTEVVGDLERLVSEHPLRERVRAQLMLALYRCGRQADALAVYQDTRRILNEELGLEPGRALRDIERAILAHDPTLDVRIEAPVSAPDDNRGRRAAGPFIGRERELAELTAAVEDARFGRGRLVVVAGEPGIGKSRLADELATAAKARGVRVLWGRCWEAGGAPAYWPWVQALRAYIREREPEPLLAELGVGAPELAHLLPELQELFPDIPEPRDLDSDVARFRLFDSTATFLRRAASHCPLVLVLDDLHVADASSLLLLDFFAAGLADARIALICLYRDPELEPGDPIAFALANAARHASVTIRLGGLDHDDVASCIELSADVEPSSDVVAAVYRETEGNPLFVSEIVRLLAIEGRLDRSLDTSWRLTIPQGVREVIGRRLRHLSKACVDVLRHASVLGREFALDALAGLEGISTREGLDLLQEAIDARLMTDVPGAPGRLRFAHALIRDTLYDEIAPVRRVDLHRRAGEALEQLYGDDVEAHLSELAHHFFLASPSGDRAKAVDIARRAGDHAQSLLAHEEAVRLYRTALQVLELTAEPAPETEARLLVSLGDAIMATGDAPTAKDTYLRGVALARSLADTELIAEAALGYAGLTVFARAGDDPLVVSLLEEALRALGTEETPLRARVLARLAAVLRDEHDPTRREALSELAVTIARRLDDDRILAHALDGRHVAILLRDNQLERLAIAEELIAIAVRTGDTQREFNGQVYAMGAQFELGNVSAALERHERFRELAEKLRQPARLWLAWASQALFDLHAGRFVDAEEHAARALGFGQSSQRLEAESAHAAQLFAFRREQGRLAEREGELARAAERHRFRPLFRCILACTECELGQMSRARRLFEELAAGDFAAIPADMEWLLAMSLISEVCVALEDRQRAAILRCLLEPFEKRLAVDTIEGSAGSVSRPLGLLAELLGDLDGAVEHLRFAIEHNDALGTPPWAAHARCDLACVLLRRGDHAAAVPLLEQADALASDLGMTALRERIARVPV